MHSAFQERSSFNRISRWPSGFITYLLSFPLYFLLFVIPHNVSVRSIGDCWAYWVHNRCYKSSINEAMKTLHQRKKTLFKAKEMFVDWVPVDVFALSMEKCPFSVSRCDLSGRVGGGGVGGGRGSEDWPACFFGPLISVTGSLGNQRDWFTELKQLGKANRDVHGIDDKPSSIEWKFRS